MPNKLRIKEEGKGKPFEFDFFREEVAFEIQAHQQRAAVHKHTTLRLLSINSATQFDLFNV